MHIDNLLVLLLVVGFGFLKWLASKVSEANKDSQGTGTKPASAPPPIPRAPVESDERQIRKFLEALGQPPGSSPPPVTQRPTYRKPPFASPLPPLTTKPPELPKRITLPGQISPAPYQKKTFKTKAAEASFEIQQAAATAPSAPPPPIKSPAETYAAATSPTPAPVRNENSITALLRTPSGLRNAMILREIFGPPRSLQPLDFTGSA
jgi:hypothetical protein